MCTSFYYHHQIESMLHSHCLRIGQEGKVQTICLPYSYRNRFNGLPVNTLSLRQNGRHFADNPFKCIFLNENVGISIKISLNFVTACQYSSIGSDNDLAPTRRLAIIWTNDGLITNAYMHHSASMIKIQHDSQGYTYHMVSKIWLTLCQVMAWCKLGAKPLPEVMLT